MCLNLFPEETPLLFDSCKQPPSVSDHSVFALRDVRLYIFTWTVRKAISDNIRQKLILNVIDLLC